MAKPRDHAHADQANAEDDKFFDVSKGAMASAAQNALKSFIDRIENLNSDKDDVQSDIKEVYSEAKGNGFDPKIIRAVIRLRKMDPGKRAEIDALVDLYLTAIGGL